MNGKLSSHNEPTDIKSLLDVVVFIFFTRETFAYCIERDKITNIEIENA